MSRYFELSDEELEQVELRAQRIAQVRIQRLAKAARDAEAMGDCQLAYKMACRALRSIHSYRTYRTA